MSLKSKVSSVIFWSVISAAFIGPGTLTTAITAGSEKGLLFLWPLFFSVLGCIAIQEAVSRATINSGLSLGEAVSKKFDTKGRISIYAMAFCIFLGCGAYEAGNILGAVAGVELILGSADYSSIIILGLGLAIAILFQKAGLKKITAVLSLFVFVMGLVFISIAIYAVPNNAPASQLPLDFFSESSLWITLGLIGTTIVPYNLFLGSGVSKGQTVYSMRFGLITSILIGGIISGAILISGTLLKGAVSFPAMAQIISEKTFLNGAVFMGLGLFAAGFTSSVTAPLAAVITFRSIFSAENKKFNWVWQSILVAALFFAFTGIKPIPVILLAQALNALFLPVVLILLIVLINDEEISTKKNTLISNVLVFIFSFAISTLGIIGLYKTGLSLFTDLKPGTQVVWIAAGISALLHLLLGIYVFRKQ